MPQAFTAVEPSESATGSTHHFYQTLGSLDSFINSLKDGFCKSEEACQSRSKGLETAASLDFTFDATASVAKLTAFWPLQDQPLAIDTSSSRRTEVGILTSGSPPNMGPHDVGISGILTVLGEQKKPSATVFAFPSRHRLSGAQFSSQFLAPTGLHPSLQLSLSDSHPPVEDAGCLPYAYLTLPKTTFADRYQLDDDLFMASKNLTASRYTSLPVDLEAPAYTTETWGSNVLLQLAPPSSLEEQAWTAEVPLHLRYLEPSATGERAIEVPYPAVFWACPAEPGTNLDNNPFDRSKLGYDGLFGAETVFWHVKPQPADGGKLVNSINVPVLKDDAASWVGIGTTAAVALGFGWIMWKLVSSYIGSESEKPSSKNTKTSKDKKKNK